MRAFAQKAASRHAYKRTISISRRAAARQNNNGDKALFGAAAGFFPPSRRRRRRIIGKRDENDDDDDDVVIAQRRRRRTKNISFVVVGKAAASWDDENNNNGEEGRRRGNEEEEEEEEEEEDSSNGGASVYSQPEVYAHAFGGFRDFTKEVDALHQLYALEGGKGTKMRTLLELGCGPAWHSIEHAKKVIREKHKEKQERGERRNDVNVNDDDDDDEDVVSVALDVNREMVSFAIERASEAKAGANDTKSILDAVDVVLGDMRDLSTHLPGKYLKKGGYFDCATLLLGTAAHLLTHDDLARTFREAFKCLRENGIFVVEVEHPMTTLFSGDLKYQYGEENAWEVRLGGSNNTNTNNNNNNNNNNSSNSSSNGGSSSNSSSSGPSRSGEDEVEKEETMRIVWGDPENDVFDATNQILYRTVSVQKYYSTDTLSEDGDDDDDEVGLAVTFVRDPHYESKEIVKCKLFTLPELIAVASAVGFRLIDSFGDLDVNVRFDCENAQNMVVAFRKD